MESQPFKFIIPKREYNVPDPTENTANKVIPANVKPKVEETKKDLSSVNAKPIAKNVDIKDVNKPALQSLEAVKVPDDSLMNKSEIKAIKKKFKLFRKDLKKKCKEKVAKLAKEYEIKKKEITDELDSEIAELNKLQESIIHQMRQEKKDQISQQTPAKTTQVSPGIAQVKPSISNTTEIVSSKLNSPTEYILSTEDYIDLNMKYVLNYSSLSITQKNTTMKMLFNEIDTNLYICNNLCQTEFLKFPLQFNKGSNFLLFSEKDLLVIGNNCPVYILDLTSKSLNILPNLQVNRAFFALSFIRGRAAVIGGINETGECLKTVEVLDIYKKKFRWIMFNEMNKARSHCQSIKHIDFTYVFGGMSGSYLATIERCKNKQWILLSVELPSILINFPLCSKGEKIYLFGGNDLFKPLSSVISFNPETLKFETEKDLINSFSAYSNACVRLIEGNFYLFDASNSKIIKYLPD